MSHVRPHVCTGAECYFCGAFGIYGRPEPLGMLASFRDSLAQPVSRMPTQLAPSATIVILRPGWVPGTPREVVVQQRADNQHWALPGGRMEIGESILDCARREALEETGLAVEIASLVCVDSDPAQYAISVYPGGDVVQYCCLTFLAYTSLSHLTCSEESLAVTWASSEALPQPFLPAHRWRLEQALAVRTTVAVR